MNKQVMNFGTRFVILAGLVVSLSFSGFAANKENAKESASAVQYLGASDQGIVFNVKYDNAASSPFSLIIKNEYGDIIYQQQYSAKSFDKKVVLAKEPGDAHLTFIIKSPSDNIKQSFDITTKTKTVEEVVVKSATK